MNFLCSNRIKRCLGFTYADLLSILGMRAGVRADPPCSGHNLCRVGQLPGAGPQRADGRCPAGPGRHEPAVGGLGFGSACLGFEPPPSRHFPAGPVIFYLDNVN